MKPELIPICPFPKGKEAGIRCRKLIVTRFMGSVCPEPECAYHG